MIAFFCQIGCNLFHHDTSIMITRSFRFRFTVVSYNILSQSLLHNHNYLYNKCDPKDLEWPTRGHRILNELLGNRADIICLQEVESEHLSSLYRPKLAHHGYDCLFKKKTGLKVDGCAIFYKRNLFHLVNVKNVEFNRRDIASQLNRDNVGIIAVLKPRSDRFEKTQLVVANTHLLFNPKQSKIRLAQMKLFLSELESISSDRQAFGQSEDPCHPTILCGDLNSLPNSAIIRYISQNSSPSNQATDPSESSTSIPSSNDQDSESYMPLQSYNHPFKFLSVYEFYDKRGQPLVSTFSHCIVDYMFYTPRLQLESYKELLTERQLRDVEPIPNMEFPSDHITLVARFSLKLK